MTDYIRQHGNTLEFNSGSSWVILNSIEKSIKEKIEKVGVPLKDWDISINYGIKTGCNEAFIIDKIKRDELISKDRKSAEIIRPILRGRDIKRYGYEFAEQYVILAYYGSHKIIPMQYPAVFNHLNQYEKKLRNRGQCHYTSNGKPNQNADFPGQHHWLELDNNPRQNYLDDFSKQKIIFQEMVQEPSFIYDKDGKYFCLDTARIITGNNIDYLISILNSKLFFFAIKTFYGGGGLGESGVRMKHTFFECFPCLVLDEKSKQILINLSKSAIKNIKKEGFNAIDNQINDFIYGLYGISEEEIKEIDEKIMYK